MRPLSESAARVAGRSFQKKHIALGRILTSWAEIVGRDLALKAQPLRIQYRKYEKRKEPSATLEIAVSGADATLLHYQADLILERMAQIFGERWITAIRFIPITAVAAPQARRSGNVYNGHKNPLTAQQKNTLSDMLSQISDTEIQDKLNHLGQAILTTK